MRARAAPSFRRDDIGRSLRDRKHTSQGRLRSRGPFLPLRHHLGDAISQHAPLAEPEIKCMGNCKRDNVAWPVD